MDPISFVLDHRELRWVALAIFTITETIRRVGLHVDLGTSKSWGLVLTLIPLGLGALSGVSGFVPAETWQNRLVMGISVALPVMVVWKVAHETTKLVLPSRGGKS